MLSGVNLFFGGDAAAHGPLPALLRSGRRRRNMKSVSFTGLGLRFLLRDSWLRCVAAEPTKPVVPSLAVAVAAEPGVCCVSPGRAACSPRYRCSRPLLRNP
ncbi:hypothetical protein EVAR_70588_1 [Eumeta japonica]|uniref:Uncharacterized protein n=1 Tax=Eumeta variegata TaxID=151549 RepID=A0A4C1SIR7_EUMVA|nr:hypothetical protein EVAR_70588_1 [Eumeta japonica]